MSAVLRGVQRALHGPPPRDASSLGEADYRLSSIFKIITTHTGMSGRVELPIDKLQKQNNREPESGKGPGRGEIPSENIKGLGPQPERCFPQGSWSRVPGVPGASRDLTPTSQPLSLLPPSKSLLSLSLSLLYLLSSSWQLAIPRAVSSVANSVLCTRGQNEL